MPAGRRTETAVIAFLACRVAVLTAVLAAVSVLAFAAATAGARPEDGGAGSLVARYLSWLMGLAPDAAAQERLWSSAALNGTAVLVIVLVSLPAAVYAATRPRGGNLGDRSVELFAGLALAAPPFLIAVIVIAAAGGSLGRPWPEGAAPASTWDRVWLPALFIGAWGSGRMIRHLRRYLALDSAAVIGGRARGLSRRRAFLRYAVGAALGPFLAGLGRLVPQLVSASMVVSWVLALPTAGALMLEALSGRDIGLAATVLVHLVAATVVGALMIDLLRLAVDPRLRGAATKRDAR